MAKLFLAAEKGEHVLHPGVRYIKARAFRLTPDPSPPVAHALLDVDGERLPYVVKPHLRTNTLFVRFPFCA